MTKEKKETVQTDKIKKKTKLKKKEKKNKHPIDKTLTPERLFLYKYQPESNQLVPHFYTLIETNNVYQQEYWKDGTVQKYGRNNTIIQLPKVLSSYCGDEDDASSDSSSMMQEVIDLKDLCNTKVNMFRINHEHCTVTKVKTCFNTSSSSKKKKKKNSGSGDNELSTRKYSFEKDSSNVIDSLKLEAHVENPSPQVLELMRETIRYRLTCNIVKSLSSKQLGKTHDFLKLLKNTYEVDDFTILESSSVKTTTTISQDECITENTTLSNLFLVKAKITHAVSHIKEGSVNEQKEFSEQLPSSTNYYEFHSFYTDSEKNSKNSNNLS
ncbi:hypothetical protein FDP41_001932 [Naegleria fowleri]|uniref:Uncharacterized protein n=1 Tax=Naegleria fowleri TaxID=5763 RepID=A0A6A5BW54_NAEFO|nr:uncharacterized protein FDP41_001932 [Naegleria fowleri]KAF0978862.1 hypothetical protein FDP41_001932 [Naegleria fowleri]